MGLLIRMTSILVLFFQGFVAQADCRSFKMDLSDIKVLASQADSFLTVGTTRQILRSAQLAIRMIQQEDQSVSGQDSDLQSIQMGVAKLQQTLREIDSAAMKLENMVGLLPVDLNDHGLVLESYVSAREGVSLILKGGESLNQRVCKK